MKKILPLLLIIISINTTAQPIIDKEWSPPDTPKITATVPFIIIDSMPMTKAVLFLTRCEDCSFISRSGFVSGFFWNPHYYDRKKRLLLSRKFYREAFIMGWVDHKHFQKHVFP